MSEVPITALIDHQKVVWNENTKLASIHFSKISIIINFFLILLAVLLYFWKIPWKINEHSLYESGVCMSLMYDLILCPYAKLCTGLLIFTQQREWPTLFWTRKFFSCAEIRTRCLSVKLGSQFLFRYQSSPQQTEKNDFSRVEVVSSDIVICHFKVTGNICSPSF